MRLSLISLLPALTYAAPLLLTASPALCAAPAAPAPVAPSGAPAPAPAAHTAGASTAEANETVQKTAAAIREIVTDPSPQKPNTSRLEFGYQGNVRRGEKDELYYRLDVQGQSLLQQGEPITLKDLQQAPQVKPPESGPRAFVLRAERGAVSTDGGIFNALGVRTFRLPFFPEDLRGAAQFSGGVDGEELHFAAGLETRPYHPLSRILQLKVPNWLVFGLQGEAQDRDAGGRRDVALVTYRTFAGRVLGWTRSQRLTDLGNTLVDQIVKVAPTWEMAERLDRSEVAARILNQSANTVDDVVHALVDQQRERLGRTAPRDPKLWRDEVATFVRAFTSVPDQPTSALQAEAAGWYTLSGQNGPRRLNSLLAVTGTVWLSPEASAKSFVQVRYQNGFDRASPDARQHFVALLAGYEF